MREQLNKTAGDTIPRQYIEKGWGLRVQVYNSNATIAGNDVLGIRFLQVTPDGNSERSQFYRRPTSNRSNNDFYFPLSPGLLTAVEIGIDTTGVKKGECYVEVSLLSVVSTAQHVTKLASGYVHTGHYVNWPVNGNGSPVAEDDAFLRSIAGTNPAAGAEILESVPLNARWRFDGIRFTLVTDATVATRRVHLIIDDGTNTLVNIPAETTQAASLTRVYTFHDFGLTPSVVGTEIPVNMTSKKLSEAYRITTLTDNLQAGDDFAAPRIFAEEWLQE